jgi:hypothetical protein
MIAGGVIWLVVGVFALNLIFFYPFALILLGALAIADGTARQKALRDRERRDEERASRGGSR